MIRVLFTGAIFFTLTSLAFAQPCANCGHGNNGDGPQAQRGPGGPGEFGPPPEGPPRDGAGPGIDRILERFDANEDGQLQVSELADEPRAQRLLEADADEDGVISNEEFDQHVQARQGQGRREGGPEGQRGDRLAMLIERLDTNEDGTLQVSELPEGERAQRLAAADANEDGTISAEEIQAHFEQNMPNRRGQRRGGNGQGGRGFPQQ